ncbi:dTMP kinase [Calorimonas adulescens]|uniref:Thymidylate kinase n=1 Tax=Calorimonas adulescens TaxID=2606906 RepID=A0A5D8QC82_9THEO|nr:dTMP kinase [Calorimonas adulescens]TZE82142.1 dTMP kinase [Calorimonas adulescens]
MGLFISFEGVDGCGKSTQIMMLEKSLVDMGYRVVVTREPGGTPLGEKIRQILLDKSNKDIEPLTEAYLYAASRALLVRQVIRPGLSKGDFILVDRYVDSSLAYQGQARGIGIDVVEAINTPAVDGLFPDITFLLDAPVGELMGRSSKVPDRIEEEGEDFQEKVREGYRILADRYKDRYIILDAMKDRFELHREIMEHVLKKFKGD